MLRDDAVERRELFADGDLEQLLASISERQDELAANAISLGERLYARKPKAFERRLSLVLGELEVAMQHERVKAMIEAWAEAGNPELELDEKEERTAALGPLALRARSER